MVLKQKDIKFNTAKERRMRFAAKLNQESTGEMNTRDEKYAFQKELKDQIKKDFILKSIDNESNQVSLRGKHSQPPGSASKN